MSDYYSDKMVKAVANYLDVIFPPPEKKPTREYHRVTVNAVSQWRNLPIASQTEANLIQAVRWESVVQMHQNAQPFINEALILAGLRNEPK